MIHLKIHDAIELSIAKMLRNGVPEPEAEVAATIFLEAELWGEARTRLSLSRNLSSGVSSRD